MPVKYIGRTTTFKGKPLWEILGNLKNYGIGRIIVRSQHERYPEPSYIKILKVATLPHVNDNPHYPRKIVALVERTFRGKTADKPVQIESVSYKADYVLVPKDQEERYLNASSKLPEKILPRTTNFPPLLKELLIRQAKQKGEPLTEEPKLPIKYNLHGMKHYRIAEENETPTYNIDITRSTTLYLDDKCENLP
ncbi:mitochondrial ribosomal protein S34 [Colletes latitarsis]|uniref:mitochondrial ribosomal protein S34 n=1 Tax=Colletes latitarsis TaxID=2605962 RepID=UPI00403706FE